MTEELLKKIEVLINDCPSDWVKNAAGIMNKSENYIRKVSKGEIGKRNHYPQIYLIETLKKMSKEYQLTLKKALV